MTGLRHGDDAIPIAVTILDRRKFKLAGAGTDIIGTYRASVPLAEGQTIELEDSTLVVILGIRDMVQASGHTGWDQVAFVGIYEELLDAPSSVQATGSGTLLPTPALLVSS
jgi:hypothetical protein